MFNPTKTDLIIQSYSLCTSLRRRVYPLKDTLLPWVCIYYLVVHDGSQAHDAHVDVVFLADETGVLDGFGVRHRAISARDSTVMSRVTEIV